MELKIQKLRFYSQLVEYIDFLGEELYELRVFVLMKAIEPKVLDEASERLHDWLQEGSRAGESCNIAGDSSNMATFRGQNCSLDIRTHVLYWIYSCWQRVGWQRVGLRAGLRVEWRRILTAVVICCLVDRVDAICVVKIEIFNFIKKAIKNIDCDFTLIRKAFGH